MKFIFTADTHFGCKFINENADLRNRQLVMDFGRIADYADKSGIKYILLGGDMFDTPYPDENVKAAVYRVFESHSDIRFMAVCGNHDPLSMTDFYNNPPENLFVFPDSITKADMQDISVYGISLSDAFEAPDPWSGFCGDGKFITLSHGTLSGKGGFSLDPSSLAQTGAALSLLGHIHKTQSVFLPNGTRALYAGTPFGHGFDECGQKGFYVIDTDDFSYTYVNTDSKIYREYTADISSCSSIAQVMDILFKIKPQENEIARAVLVGKLKQPFDIDCDVLTEYIKESFIQIKDETTIDTDIFKSAGENTLEGKFVDILLHRLENAQQSERQQILDAIKEGVLAIRSSK